MLDLDPYKPPASSTSLESKPVRSRRLAWKIYAFAIGLPLLIAYVVAVITSFSQGLALELVLTCLAIVGLLAYAFRRKIFSRPFWSLMAIALPAYDVVSSWVIHPPENLLLPALMMAVVLPNWVAVALYAFRSPELWAPASPAPTDQAAPFSG